MHRLASVLVVVLVFVRTLAPTIADAQPSPMPPPDQPCDPLQDPACSQGTPPSPVNSPPAAPAQPAPVPPAPIPAVPAQPPSPGVLDVAQQEVLENYAPWSVRVGGFLQGQHRWRENSPQQNDEEGFRFARIRPQITAATAIGNLELAAFIEVEIQPQFAMFDAFAGVSRALPRGGRITVDVGQMRVPISRQQMLSDQALSFVDKPQFALTVNDQALAPDRDLGARLTFIPPRAPWAKLFAGSFNGEGKNKVSNINESFLHVGRLELTPIGHGAPFAESNFSGKPYVTVAASVGRNKLTKGTTHELVAYLGVDLAAAWRGLSGSIEYLEVRRTFEGPDPGLLSAPYKGNGWAAQLAYLLPFRLAPVRRARIELAARVEEVDRNDTFPISQAGDPNQSIREYTAVVSYYLRQHSLKAQLAASHFAEIEDRTSSREDAKYSNDQIVLQLTYRLE